MLIVHSFLASGSTFSRLHQQYLKSFDEAEINIRGKSIVKALGNNIANSRVSYDI